MKTAAWLHPSAKAVLLGTSLVSLCVLAPACKPASRSAESGTTWVEPNKLQPGPIRHANLTDEQLARVQRIQKVFSEVDPNPLEKWIEDFRRDQNPDKELSIWESMAVPFETFTAENHLSLEGKKEAFQVVLLRSGAPENEVLKRLKLKVLSERDVRRILSLYSAPPEPLKVMKP